MQEKDWEVNKYWKAVDSMKISHKYLKYSVSKYIFIINIIQTHMHMNFNVCTFTRIHVHIHKNFNI